MTDPQRFKVIEGGPTGDGAAKPKAYRRKRGQVEPLLCHICEEDTGVATAVSFEAKMGRMIRDGKPEGGTKAIYCLHCLTRGKVTRLV